MKYSNNIAETLLKDMGAAQPVRPGREYGSPSSAAARWAAAAGLSRPDSPRIWVTLRLVAAPLRCSRRIELAADRGGAALATPGINATDAVRANIDCRRRRAALFWLCASRDAGFALINDHNAATPPAALPPVIAAQQGRSAQRCLRAMPAQTRRSLPSLEAALARRRTLPAYSVSEVVDQDAARTSARALKYDPGRGSARVGGRPARLSPSIR
jgi:hypothetical protein